MRKKTLVLIGLLVVAGVALHLHLSRGPGLLQSLRRQIHGE